MSGWQLGLALVGCWLLGAVTAVWAVGAWARHVWRTKMGQVAGQLLSDTPGGQSVTIARPPDRADGYE